MNFVFWFFLVGFLIAALQDLKRREVDNWLNLFLFFSGAIYLVFNVFTYKEVTYLINFGFLVFFMFCLVYLFYLSKVFSGGDCKLLFAITPLLVSFNFLSSLQNVLFFVFAILFVGALYGTLWIFGLFFKDFDKTKKDFNLLFKKNSVYLISFLVFLILGFFDKIFFSLFFLLSFLVLVFLASKAVEKNSLIREINPRELREGDWLERDLRFKGRILRATFDGLSLEDILFLKSFKGKIRIKDGIPYAPVFVFAWILFYFRGVFTDILIGVI